jgi:hypothetical protein
VGVRLYPSVPVPGKDNYRGGSEFMPPQDEALLLAVTVADIELANSYDEPEDGMVEILDIETGETWFERAGYLYWTEFRAEHPEADRVRDFRLFGWGRVKFHITDCVGNTKDPDEIDHLLNVQGVFLTPEQRATFDGLFWG